MKFCLSLARIRHWTSSTIISHIVTQYNYTLSYRNAWITRTKAVERIFRNWEDSYKRLLQYLMALKHFAIGAIVHLRPCRHIPQTWLVLVEMEYSTDSSRRMNHASKLLHSVNLLYKLMEHGCTWNIKEHYSWQWHKMTTSILFQSPSL